MLFSVILGAWQNVFWELLDTRQTCYEESELSANGAMKGDGERQQTIEA